MLWRIFNIFFILVAFVRWVILASSKTLNIDFTILIFSKSVWALRNVSILFSSLLLFIDKFPQTSLSLFTIHVEIEWQNILLLVLLITLLLSFFKSTPNTLHSGIIWIYLSLIYLNSFELNSFSLSPGPSLL